jgi:uncharacterized protein involved in exopolysaccharide biosynthesis
MSTTSAWSSVPHDPPSRSDWAARARYAPTDFVTLLWRERWLMLGVFLALFLLGLAFATTMKKTYTASPACSSAWARNMSTSPGPATPPAAPCRTSTR